MSCKFRLYSTLFLVGVITSVKGGIPASILPDITNLQQDTDEFLNNFRIFEFSEAEATIVTCGDETTTNSVWQNQQYPQVEGDLPPLCTLRVTPPQDTCALRVFFDDLSLPTKYVQQYWATCDAENPFFKMSLKDGVSTTLCENLNNYEGIAELDPENTEPTMLLIQLDPTQTFKFRVNITLVPCNSIKEFESNRICGIKNEVPVPSRRNDISSERLNEDQNRKSQESSSTAGLRERTRANILAERLKYRNTNRISLTNNRLPENQRIRNAPPSNKSEQTDERYHNALKAPVSGINEYPWMVAIKRDDYETCSGVILDERRILTTASCFSRFTLGPVQDVTVYIGDHNIGTPQETLSITSKVSKITLPMNYNERLYKNDLAIVTIPTALDFSLKQFRPICLPHQYNVFNDDVSLIMGWGMEGYGTKRKHRVEEVTFANETACKEVLDNILYYEWGSEYDPSEMSIDNFTCVVNEEDYSPICYDDIGISLVRKDQTGTYVLQGLSLTANDCYFFDPSILHKIETNTTFLNIALL